MTPYECFVTYLALKRHFTSSYDFIKYNGKVNVKIETFEKRKDKYNFYKLSRQQDPFGILLSSLFNNPECWIGDMFSEEANKNYLSMRKRFESLKYIFSEDLDKLYPIHESLSISNGDQHPKALKLYNRGEISPETLIVLDIIGGIFSIWDKKITEPYMWKDIKFKLNKLAPFLTIDKKEFKDIFKKKLIEVDQ